MIYKNKLGHHWSTAILHKKHPVQWSCHCCKHLSNSSSGMALRPDVAFCWISSSDANGDPWAPSWVSERARSDTEWDPEIILAGWWLEFVPSPVSSAPLRRCDRVHCHGTGSNCFSIADWSRVTCLSLLQVLHRLHTVHSCALHTPHSCALHTAHTWALHTAHGPLLCTAHTSLYQETVISVEYLPGTFWSSLVLCKLIDIFKSFKGIRYKNVLS
jgi:hypothetical protein